MTTGTFLDSIVTQSKFNMTDPEERKGFQESMMNVVVYFFHQIKLSSKVWVSEGEQRVHNRCYHSADFYAFIHKHLNFELKMYCIAKPHFESQVHFINWIVKKRRFARKISREYSSKAGKLSGHERRTRRVACSMYIVHILRTRCWY